jgi:hypothetical protein
MLTDLSIFTVLILVAAFGVLAFIFGLLHQSSSTDIAFLSKISILSRHWQLLLQHQVFGYSVEVLQLHH